MRIKKVIDTFFQSFSPAVLNKPRVRGVLLFSGVLYFLILVALGYAWYSSQWISGFHFFNDAPEWKQMDKFAHFFWSFQVSALATRLMIWATLNDQDSARVGAVLGFVFVSSIEILDGFRDAVFLDVVG